MAAAITPGYSFGATETVTNVKLASLASGTIANIDRSNMDSVSKIFTTQSSEPTSPSLNDLWQDTSNTRAKRKSTNRFTPFDELLGIFKNHVGGCRVAYSTAARVTIATGECADSTNARLIEVTSTLTVDITASGANGLDTGAEASSTWYYVYVILNDTAGTVAGLLSASSSSPTLPSGYTHSRLVGFVRNDGSSNFLIFYTNGQDRTKEYWFDAPQSSIVYLTPSTSFGDETNTTTFVPPVPSMMMSVILEVGIDNDGAGTGTRAVLFRPEGSSSAGTRSLQVPINDGDSLLTIEVPFIMGGTVGVEFKVDSNTDLTITIQVNGFKFTL